MKSAASRRAAPRHLSATPSVVRLNRAVLALCAVGVLVFLCLPVLIVVPMSFSSSSSLRFPPEGFSLRWYAQVFGDPRWLQAMYTSLLLALDANRVGAAREPGETGNLADLMP
ncbi:MAG: ABC transporter permease, partial [Gammaproteobacteria bacterium]